MTNENKDTYFAYQRGHAQRHTGEEWRYKME